MGRADASDGSAPHPTFDAAVAAVLILTLWLRLVGAIASGWLADRIGRKAPRMLSILRYSICNVIAGFSPTFTFLFCALFANWLQKDLELAAGVVATPILLSNFAGFLGMWVLAGRL